MRLCCAPFSTFNTIQLGRIAMNISDWILYRYLVLQASVSEQTARLMREEDGVSEVTWLLIVFGDDRRGAHRLAIYRAVATKGNVVLGQIEGLQFIVAGKRVRPK